MTGRHKKSKLISIDGRGQSAAVATIALVGLVAAGGLVVVLAGSNALADMQGESSVAAAEESMRQVDATVERLAGEGSSGGAVEFPSDGKLELLDNGPTPTQEGRVTVNVTSPSGNASETYTLGTLEYATGEERMAYQGGAVFRREDGASRVSVVSEPAVKYREGGIYGTLNFPVVTLSGSVSDDGVRFADAERTSMMSASALDMANPMEPGTTVELTVTSRYYRGWETVLVEEVGRDEVSVNHTSNSVTVSFTRPEPKGTDAGIVGTYSSGTVELTNHIYIDSYDSNKSPYDSPAPDQTSGKVETVGELAINTNATVYGDVVAENGFESNTLSNRFQITGDLLVGDDPDFGVSGGSASYLAVSASGPKTQVGGKFSFRDPLSVEAATEFGGPIAVNGSFQTKSTTAYYGGTVYVNGSVLDYVRYGDFDEDLVVDGDINKIGGGTVTVDGDVVANGSVTVGTGVTVLGDVVVPNTESVSGPGTPGVTVVKDTARVESAIENAPAVEDPTVETPDPVTDDIDDHASLTTDANNDNDQENLIDGHEFAVYTRPDRRIESGEYHLQEMNVPGGDTITLDTSDGPIDFYVEDDLRVAGRLEIVGDNRNQVNVYLDQSSGRAVEVMGKAVVVDDRTSKLRVNVRPTAEVSFNSGAVFQGAMLGPPGPAGGSGTTMSIDSEELYGTFVGDVDRVTGDSGVHYDEALLDPNVDGASVDGRLTNFIHLEKKQLRASGTP